MCVGVGRIRSLSLYVYIQPASRRGEDKERENEDDEAFWTCTYGVRKRSKKGKWKIVRDVVVSNLARSIRVFLLYIARSLPHRASRHFRRGVL